ncbi:hypothetical protein ACP6H1_27175 [Vibrio harveyi]|uniref:hypothetical protein n=1 Tax=Vibrio harveyi TaxID=669 RepID=UPI003CE6ED40
MKHYGLVCLFSELSNKAAITLNSSVIVRNQGGTGERSCSCGTWLKHWEKFAESKANQCRVSGCTNKAIVGAHVRRPYAANPRVNYIIPMCSVHNGQNSDVDMTIQAHTTFVLANVSETCGR